MRTTYRFGDCRIDPSARELRRGEAPVVLSPKVFDCLAYLIERRDRAVGRDELVAAVWGKTEITDTLLGQTILKARRAVGDSADEQRVIRTVPRFGYAWAAEVTAETARESPSRVLRRSRLAWLTAIVLVPIVAAVVWLSFEHRAISAPAPTAAVLPVDVNAPAEWAWVRLGLMDAIASRLREGDQTVVPSDSVVALTTRADHAPDVAAATGAALVIVPSASWSPTGWHVRLALQGDGPPIGIEVSNGDVLVAGRMAADRMLAQLGKPLPADTGGAHASDAERLQRVEAALLTGDLDGARYLLLSAPGDVAGSPEYALRLAKVDFRAGDFDAAGRRLRELLALASVENDPVLRARVLNGLGHVALRLGHADEAAAAYGEVVTLLRDRGEPIELGHAYMGRGNAARLGGEDERARADFSQARVAFRLAGDELSAARVEANEGMLDAARDRHAEAVIALDRAAQRFERFGTLNELAVTTSAQIASHLALLQPRAALAASDRAWPFRERMSDPRIRHALAVNRALALEASGRRNDAQALLEDVIGTADPEREKTVLAFTRGASARIALAAGRAQQATDLSLAAVTDLDERVSERTRLMAWLTRTRALRALGRVDEASDAADRLAALAPANGSSTVLLYASLARAEQLVANGQVPAGSPEFARAFDIAVRAGVPVDIAEVAVSYAAHLIDSGDLERAGAVVGQAARWADEDFACAVLQARWHAALAQRQAWQHAATVARTLAGDREIPAELTVYPGDVTAASR